MQISIVGGELYNKGAQAMVFAVVNEVKMRYPSAKVTLLSGIDFNRSQNDKLQYRFEILPWDIRLKLRTFFGMKLIIDAKHFTPEEEQRALNVFTHSDLIIDVSGYALSSVFSNRRVASYLLDLYLAKRFKRNIVFMPQSFGPFQFGILQMVVKLLIKRLMRVPLKVYAREKSGFELMSGFVDPDKLSLCCDTVLQSPSPSPDNVFENYVPAKVHFNSGSVAIIPNEKVFKHNKKNDLEKIYVGIINHLLKIKKEVVLIYHSHEDLILCKKIKQSFEHNEKVSLIERELNAIDLSSVIESMDFIIASRYHAVVHAYKEKTPAMVIGWADKYAELMGLFDQQVYNLDIRDTFTMATITPILNNLASQQSLESRKIEEKLNVIQHHSIFNDVFDAFPTYE